MKQWNSDTKLGKCKTPIKKHSKQKQGLADLMSLMSLSSKGNNITASQNNSDHKIKSLAQNKF